MKHQIHPLGDHGLCISWGNVLDKSLSAHILNLYALLCQANLPGVRDIVPAYCSLSIVFDTPKMLRESPGVSPFHCMRLKVEQILEAEFQIAANEGRLLEIPVCYDLALAPDLESIALKNGLEVQEVVRLHTSTEYRVYMIGFLPGFPYMGDVDERIAAPRLISPRQKVPAGSVGIAGRQTGIYPLDSPGGWNLVGRTPMRIFDPWMPDPVLFQPGDRVRFVPVSLHEFRKKSARS